MYRGSTSCANTASMITLQLPAPFRRGIPKIPAVTKTTVCGLSTIGSATFSIKKLKLTSTLLMMFV